MKKGAKKGDIRAIAVATDITPPASPCGMCRQFIKEFCEVSSLERRQEITLADNYQPKMPVLMYDKDGKSTVMTVEQLLPFSFGIENLITAEQAA